VNAKLFRLLVFALVPTPAVIAADLAAEARAERPKLVHDFPEAFAPVTDDPKLPRVLLIGDSISIGYTPAVRELLRGVANVHRIPDNGGPTTRGLALLEEWLGNGRWDVIHFNFGLHDIALVDDGAFRVKSGDYEANLKELVGRLNLHRARLIWASTTPVPNVPVRPPRKNDHVVMRNQSAKVIMDRFGVALNDLYSVALPQLGRIQQPANVHFTPEGYRVLAEAVVAAIRAQLPSTTK
jgi:acyl-CoA thioesterase-1